MQMQVQIYLFHFLASSIISEFFFFQFWLDGELLPATDMPEGIEAAVE